MWHSSGPSDVDTVCGSLLNTSYCPITGAARPPPRAPLLPFSIFLPGGGIAIWWSEANPLPSLDMEPFGNSLKKGVGFFFFFSISGKQAPEAVQWVTEQFCGFYPLLHVPTKSLLLSLVICCLHDTVTKLTKGNLLWKPGNPSALVRLIDPSYPWLHCGHLREHVTVWLTGKKSLIPPKSLFSSMLWAVPK